MNKNFFNSINLYKICFLFLFFFYSNNLISFSQEQQEEIEYNYEEEMEKMKTKPRFGLFVDYNLNYHNTSFKALPGIPNCCTLFEKGFGSGLEYGGNVQLFINKFLSYGIRLSLGNLHGVLNKYDEIPVILNGEIIPGKIENKIDISNNLISISPFISYRIEPVSNNLYSYFSAKIGIPIDVTYSQYEKLLEPVGSCTFIDGTTIRNIHSGKLDSKSSFLAAASVGLGYDIPLNKVGFLVFTPEIYFNYWFLTPVKDLSWNVFQIAMGASIKYIQPPPPPPPPAEPMLPILPELPFPDDEQNFIVDINAYKIDLTGNKIDDVTIKVEDFTYVSLKPLLNYIFFDKNSSELPLRYKLLNRKQADNFDIKILRELDPVETYYHILNIVGKRLREFPNAKIKLVGTNANIDEEKGNLELSEARAISVKNYFVDVWKIDEDRIKVSAINLPKEPTTSLDNDGIDENMRVEILSDDIHITESILTFDTLKVIEEADIEFVPEVTSTFDVKDWDIVISQNGKEIEKWSGSNNIPSEIKWKIEDDNHKYNQIKSRKENLKYVLNVTDKIGQKVSSKLKDIDIQRMSIDAKRSENQSDTEFERYSLILFDFGSSKLGYEHKQTVDYIKKRIKPNSEVNIIGYSDAIGDSLVNSKLALERAKAVVKRLQILNAEVHGVGEAEILYQDNLPECRFYCRTVMIDIKTPIDNGN